MLLLGRFITATGKEAETPTLQEGHSIRYVALQLVTRRRAASLLCLLISTHRTYNQVHLFSSAKMAQRQTVSLS